ncbi:MAG: ABC transporter ATP-binding protein [Candidatus Marinimicrobia bacterium]|nr:ABC transporter ATP-binding protein [Candidatus Neomarinimicrobiota bacterium]
MSHDYAIHIQDLTKSYPGVIAVDSLDLHVHTGEIYGFLGLNGAGKTTTIRAILGMIKPEHGKIEVLGHPIGPNGKGPWSRVGYMVETPAAYPELTVRENLEIARRMHAIEDEERVDVIISELKLERYSERKAGHLSTGNLQRLGLARALIHKPELLLLDEPGNGLDPAGVVEIRALLKALTHEQGITVLMSSHILSEVDRLADRIGIIHNGHLIEEYDAEGLENLRSQRLAIKVEHPEQVMRLLESAGHQIRQVDGELKIVDASAIASPQMIAQLLVESGHPPSKLVLEHEDLEDHFLRLTGGQV